MIDYELVLADLQERRADLDIAIKAIEPLATKQVKGNGQAPTPRGAKRGRKKKATEPAAETTEGPGTGRKRCPHCGQTSGTRAKRCEHCLELFA